DPNPEVKPEPTPDPNPEVKPEPTPDPNPEVKPEPTPDPNPEVKPEPTPDPNPDVKPEPTPDPKPEVKPEPTPDPNPEVKPEPTPDPKPETVIDKLTDQILTAGIELGSAAAMSLIVAEVLSSSPFDYSMLDFDGNGYLSQADCAFILGHWGMDANNGSRRDNLFSKYQVILNAYNPATDPILP
ncbi:MAG: hypothetical protein RSB55_00400, partial [Oscillospiraceae bacterium]